MPSVTLPNIDERRRAILDAFIPGLVDFAGIASVNGSKAEFVQELQLLADEIKQKSEDARGILHIIAEAGWPPPLALDLADLSLIEMLHQELDRNQFVNALEGILLTRYNHEGVDQFAASWSKIAWLQPRMHILKAGIKAHERGEYALSIPALLAQIEGIVATGYGHKGHLSQRRYIAYLDRLLTADWDVMGDMALTNRVMIECLLADFGHNQVIPSLSRHAILHGADVSYPTEANSLKAILLLDRVVDSFRVIAAVGDPSYHIPGCPALLENQSARSSFFSEEVARAQGLVPCARCAEPPMPAAKRE